VMVDQRLCGCGSGLRAARCCEMNVAAAPPPEAARPLLPMIERAGELHRQGNVAEAEGLCLNALELAPTSLEALTLLYRIRQAAGTQPATDRLLHRIVHFHPNTLWATHELALALFNKGAVFEAEINARNAVRIAPENPQSHNLMGMILTEANRPQVGEYHYRKVLELTGGREPIVLANLAWNLKNQGKMAEARALYEEAAGKAPDVLQTLLGWARMEEADRNFDKEFVLKPGTPEGVSFNPQARTGSQADSPLTGNYTTCQPSSQFAVKEAIQPVGSANDGK